MKRVEALDIIAPSKGDGVSVATMRAIGAWYAAGGTSALHVDVSVMGCAAAVGLGLALARPDKRVLVFDGDGSLLMELGVLASIAEAAPVNLYHFVLVNRLHETSGDFPIAAARSVDFPAIALAAGYRHACRIDDAPTLREHLPSILDAGGPVLIALEVEPQLAGDSHLSIAVRRWRRLRALYGWRGLFEELRRVYGWRGLARQMLRFWKAPPHRDQAGLVREWLRGTG